MKINELTYDEKNRVYLNPDKVISYSDGEKNEQYTFESLKNSKDTSIFSMELFNCIRDWSSEYHFTTYRANILRPLDIKKEDKILEIGAGCGAISRYLGETGATVTAVEGSLSRARCIAERCRDLDNVTVVCSNIEDVEFEEKFDIITLIGVFEYTAKYSRQKDPFNVALKNYLAILKPTGSLVIAIENKLGLKYFAGFNEDHYSAPYFGLESRYRPEDITTFGHKEIKAMLTRNGYSSVEFLYPFPDYKLPKVIFTDKGLEHSGFNVADLIRFTKDRHYNPRPKANSLNEYLVWESLGDNSLIKNFSNSFLILAGKSQTQKLVNESLLAQYYTCNRIDPYNTLTSFFEEGTQDIGVQKQILGNEAIAVSGHGVMQNIDKKTKYTKGYNLHHAITGALFKRWYSEYERLMQNWVNFLKSEGLANNGKENEVRAEYFDALPFNLIVDKTGKYQLFDQEWKIDEAFDITFLLVRYLSMHRRNKGIYSGYATNFIGFVNKTLTSCGLEKISRSSLKRFRQKDENIRAKINRSGGIAPLQIKKSLIFLALSKLKEVKQYLYYGWFAQR